MSEDLKLCSHCNSFYIDIDHDGQTGWYGECVDCGCNVGPFEDKAEAERHWNRRPIEDALRAELGQALNEAERARELRAERDALRDLHREICVALEQRGYQAFANEDIGKLIDQITHDHKIQFSRAEQAEADNFRLRELIRDAVDCWFNHDKRGDHAEMQAMYALRTELETTRARLAEACRIKAGDKVDFDWALLGELRRLHESEDFHPRAAKLMSKRKNFVVVAEDEPYFGKVYRMIREREQAIGRWTDEDELNFRAATQPPRREW